MSKMTLDSILKNYKLSFTQQRRVILEEVYNTDTHMTADEIYLKVKKRMNKVSIGTIYRNLNMLVSLNLIDKLDTSLHSESYYETAKDPHYHIICTKCLKIVDLEHYRALSIEPTAEKISGYKINNHIVEIHGLCPVCKNHQEPINKPEQNMKKTPEKHFPQKTIMTIDDRIKKEINQIYEDNSNKPDKTKQYPRNTYRHSSNKHAKRKFFFGRRNQNN